MTLKKYTIFKKDLFDLFRLNKEYLTYGYLYYNDETKQTIFKNYYNLFEKYDYFNENPDDTKTKREETKEAGEVFIIGFLNEIYKNNDAFNCYKSEKYGFEYLVSLTKENRSDWDLVVCNVWIDWEEVKKEYGETAVREEKARIERRQAKAKRTMESIEKNIERNKNLFLNNY